MINIILKTQVSLLNNKQMNILPVGAPVMITNTKAIMSCGQEWRVASWLICMWGAAVLLQYRNSIRMQDCCNIAGIANVILSFIISLSGSVWCIFQKLTELNPHQYSCQNLLIRTTGVHLDPTNSSYLSDFYSWYFCLRIHWYDYFDALIL